MNFEILVESYISSGLFEVQGDVLYIVFVTDA
jgi:hypothetical protein